jgi:DNA mismatch repair ATPase MutS
MLILYCFHGAPEALKGVLGIKKHRLAPNTQRWRAVSQTTPPSPLEELIQETTRERRLERAVEELSSRLKLLRADYNFIIKLMRDSGLLELADLYEQLKNCTEEYTWVLNKQGKRYYYYYLKCKTGDRRSIYIGKTPEGYNQLRKAAQLAFQLKTRLEAVVAAMRELELQLEELKANTATVESALSKIKK